MLSFLFPDLPHTAIKDKLDGCSNLDTPEIRMLRIQQIIEFSRCSDRGNSGYRRGLRSRPSSSEIAEFCWTGIVTPVARQVGFVEALNHQIVRNVRSHRDIREEWFLGIYMNPQSIVARDKD